MVAGIIGATGYAGAELARLLRAHSRIDRLALASASFAGEDFTTVYPNFRDCVEEILDKPEAVIEKSDVVFAALPNGLAEPFAVRCAQRGIPFIDMSADFRFDDDSATYKAWYGKDYAEPELHRRSVYGLTEFNRAAIQKATRGGRSAPALIGNPGCYPTASALGAWPALAKGLAAPGTLIVDAASGITGGGREPQRSFHFPECYDSYTAYKVGAHRHTPEIERTLRAMECGLHGASSERKLIFTPHLAPMNRGILATLYIPLDKAHRMTVPGGAARPPSAEITEKAAAIRAMYADFYAEERFVRVLPEGVHAATNRVRGSNFCDISIHLDQSGATLIILSAIDNMVKGAAGQAIQNMNIIFEFDEDDALRVTPSLF